MEEKKITVITGRPNQDWEYRCVGCRQLRLYIAKDDEKPTKCGACNCTVLNIGRPGTLPTKEEE